MKSNMCIHVEFLAGTDFVAAAREAADKTRLLDVAYICYEFNGIKVSVRHNVDISLIDRAYELYLEIQSNNSLPKHLII